MKYIVTINDKSYEVEVEKGQASIVKTTQVAQAPAQTTAQVSNDSEPAARSENIAAQTSTTEGEPLKSPMPGTIVAVKVNSNDAVKKGDVLLILEAMKMENEITALRDGVISQILVAKGASVSTGDILLTLK